MKILFHNFYKRFKRWLNISPDNDDLFFSNIREFKHKHLPCDHVWVVFPVFRRRCNKCWKEQVMIIREFGEDEEEEWVDLG